jgi:hypothetical protein
MYKILVVASFFILHSIDTGLADIPLFIDRNRTKFYPVYTGHSNEWE